LAGASTLPTFSASLPPLTAITIGVWRLACQLHGWFHVLNPAAPPERPSAMLGCDRPSADAARAADTAVECEGAKRSPGMVTSL